MQPSTIPKLLLTAGALGLLALPLAARDERQEKLPCVYVAAPSAEDPEPMMEEHPGCAVLGEDGRARIAPAHVAAAERWEGYATMLIAGDWYYVKDDGTALLVLTYDNGPDAWSEGLARSRRDGKVVYVNEAFEEVVGPRYDWGWPFEDGRALVCLGCRLEESDDEHRAVVGGRWGYVDASGAEVVPVRYSREEARARGKGNEG